MIIIAPRTRLIVYLVLLKLFSLLLCATLSAIFVTYILYFGGFTTQLKLLGAVVLVVGIISYLALAVPETLLKVRLGELARS